MLREDGAAPSLAALASRIGCSAPALYAHFANKDDLLEQVRIRAQADLGLQKQRHYAEAMRHPLRQLEDGGQAYIDFARHNPALYRLIFAPGHARREEHFRLDRQAIAPLASGVRSAQEIGYFTGVDADDMARLLWFALHGAIMMALNRQVGEDDEAGWQQARQTIKTFMHLFPDT